MRNNTHIKSWCAFQLPNNGMIKYDMEMKQVYLRANNINNYMNKTLYLSSQ